MTSLHQPLLLTHDAGLQRHWARALDVKITIKLNQLHPLKALTGVGVTETIVWLDLSLPHLPLWDEAEWLKIFQNQHIKVVAASSSPNDEEGMVALDAGCAAYCHAFSDPITLQRIQETVLSGNVWVGRSLMNRLLRNTARIAQKVALDTSQWHQSLTQREVEIAGMAANGASNLLIASECGITERTVKAHLSAVFEKLNVSDRLQLALRVHGIQ